MFVDCLLLGGGGVEVCVRCLVYFCSHESVYEVFVEYSDYVFCLANPKAHVVSI